MNLYNKVRPSSFEEVKGNGAIVRALHSIFFTRGKKVEYEFLPHAFLFHGDSGTGKTTLARIVAKVLGCAPMSCIEVNAADTRGIDSMREIVEGVGASPLAGACRVVILDEAHQLTAAAQNVLLKALEDSAEHTFWILCTTSLSGIITTVRNRCSMYGTRLLRKSEVRSVLLDAIAQEYLEDNEEADSHLLGIVDLICAHTDGSARKALVLLEKVISLEDLSAVEDIVASECIESVSPETLAICKLMVGSLRKGKWAKVREFLKGTKEEPEKIRLAIIGFARYELLREGCSEDQILLLIKVLETLSRPCFGPGGKSLLAKNLCILCFDFNSVED